MSIRVKVLAGFLFVISMAIMLGVISIKSLSNLGNDAVQVGDRVKLMGESAEDLSKNVNNLTGTIKRMGEVTMEIFDLPLMAISFSRSAQNSFVQAKYYLLKSSIEQGEAKTKALESAKEAFDLFMEDLDVAKERALNEDITKNIETILTDAAKWKEQKDALLTSNPNANILASKELSEIFEQIEANLEMLIDLQTIGGFEYRNKAEELIEASNSQVEKSNVAVAASSEQVESVKKQVSDSIYNVTKSKSLNQKVVVVAAFAGIVVALFMASNFIRPIKVAVNIAERIAFGEFDNEIDTTRKDEMGQLLRSLSEMQQSLAEQLERDREIAREKEAESKLKEARQKNLMELTGQLGESVSNGLMLVLTSSDSLRVTADSIMQAANTTSDKSDTVSAAAERTNTTVQSVAGSTRELSNSISEISQSAASSSNIARNAVEEANQADLTVQSLASAAQKIGDVVSLINAIASKINLLSLNATIEAARAGDAGKGFAVVASEVKTLATQTAQATEEITNQITGVQTATENAVVAIQNIVGIINEISNISVTIASAVEEQGAATQEIARHIESAADDTCEVTLTISDVTVCAEDTKASVMEVIDATNDLSKQSISLKTDVEDMLDKIRKA